MDTNPIQNRPTDPSLDRRSREFLAASRTATLATVAPDGRPRLVPICFVVGDDDPVGQARLYSALDDKPKAVDDPLRLARVRDIVARPDAVLLVDRWSEDWQRLGWLRLDVRAEVVEPGPGEHADAVRRLRVAYPQYAGHRLEERPILRFAVARSLAWGNLDPD